MVVPHHARSLRQYMHFGCRQVQALDARRKSTDKQERRGRRRGRDGDLRREESRRQPSPDHRPGFNRFAGDQGLEEGTYACARGIAVATLFDRPGPANDADHDVRGRGDPFLCDDELHLADTCGT